MASRRPQRRHPDDPPEDLEDPPRQGGGPVAGPDPRLFERTSELRRLGRPFALATVVAVQRPTSARPGARGIVHPDGAIEGWVGGSCAQPMVVREALRALADGQPRLLRLSRTLPSDSRRGDGIVELVMTCHSGGTLEIYVEPQLPAPALWVTGVTPIAGALASVGAGLGFAVTVVDPVADPEMLPDGVRVIREADLSGLDEVDHPYVVVASQGQWDEEALEAALVRDVAYVGLVASPKRAAAVRAYLAENGVPPERLAALRAPAGIDLGAETAEEIAISILAELVQVRRGRAAFIAAPGPATLAAGGQAQAIAPAPEIDDIVLLDPVCGMTVEREFVRHIAEHDGTVYAFCSIGCRARFMKDPAGYVGAGTPTGA